MTFDETQSGIAYQLKEQMSAIKWSAWLYLPDADGAVLMHPTKEQSR